MNDRDTFAAAALTGLIANGDYSVESTPLLAYRMAHAMLRERGTNLDAAPAARADSTHERPPNVRCQQAVESRCAASGSGSGTGNTPPPHATQPQGGKQGEGSVPDSRTANEPVAWLIKGVMYDSGCEYQYVTDYKENSEAAAKDGGTVTPLYRSPTLTDAEMQAMERAKDGYIAWMEDNVLLDEPEVQATLAVLRGLLERTK